MLNANTFKFILLFIINVLVFGCCSNSENSATENTDSELGRYPIVPVDIRNVKLTDNFWLPIVQRVQEKTITYALQKCKDEGRFENFLVAGGKMKGTTRGQMPFDDTDVYKIIEGASNSLIIAPNKKLEQLLDSLINLIAVGQEHDGYLTTWRTINPAKPPAHWVKVIEGKRWESLAMSHELYNAGHLYEAAAVHFQATGKSNFLNIATKNADLMVSTFGPGKIEAVPGHQIIETGLIKLYQITGKKEYLDLSKYFLDNRGKPDHHELFGAYSQDHVPVTQQDEVVGHAVRAMYMYAAMTDIGVLNQELTYQKAVEQLWSNMIEKKTYITGGIGARHEGESFGDNFELPNLTAYNETCAAIGSIYWNHRLHSQTGKVKYLDVLERTLYNGLISGLSLDGTHFFYPNALESDGKYEFNQGACTRKSWFDCSCCPTNLVRCLPSVAGLIYSQIQDTLYINLYAGSEATVQLPNQTLHIQQRTDFPWDGKVEIVLSSDVAQSSTIKFRIPSWARNLVMPGNLYYYIQEQSTFPTLNINGQEMSLAQKDGYFVITKKWSSDTVRLSFPMTVRKVMTDARVTDNRGKVALEYGPLVYAYEEVDNAKVWDKLMLTASDSFDVNMEDTLLGGVNSIQGNGFKAIPYYAWSNRGIGKMKVWVNYQE